MILERWSDFPSAPASAWPGIARAPRSSGAPVCRRLVGGVLARWWGRMWLHGLARCRLKTDERRARAQASETKPSRKSMSTLTAELMETEPASPPRPARSPRNSGSATTSRCRHNADTENALVEKYLPLVSVRHGPAGHDFAGTRGSGRSLQRRPDRPASGAAQLRSRLRQLRLKLTRASACAARCWMNCAGWTGCRAPFTRRRARIKDVLGELEQKLGQHADRGADGQGDEPFGEGIRANCSMKSARRRSSAWMPSIRRMTATAARFTK